MTTSAARYRVLEQIYDLLSNYLVDACRKMSIGRLRP
jgi:hypothetical protein